MKTSRRSGNTFALVPTLRVGTHVGTLCVSAGYVGFLTAIDAERPGLRSHAERGNEN